MQMIPGSLDSWRQQITLLPLIPYWKHFMFNTGQKQFNLRQLFSQKMVLDAFIHTLYIFFTVTSCNWREREKKKAQPTGSRDQLIPAPWSDWDGCTAPDKIHNGTGFIGNIKIPGLFPLQLLAQMRAQVTPPAWWHPACLSHAGTAAPSTPWLCPRPGQPPSSLPNAPGLICLIWFGFTQRSA